MKGRKKSEDTKRKVSEKMKGIVRSDITKKKISLGIKDSIDRRANRRKDISEEGRC